MRELLTLILVMLPLSAWIVHVMGCMVTEKWGFLFLAIVFPPFGVFNGALILLGLS